MSLLNGEIIKSKVRSLPVSFISDIVFKLWHDNKYLKESIYSMFYCLCSDPAIFRTLAHHVQGFNPPCYTPRAKARLPIGLTGVHPKLIAMLSRGSLSDNIRQACLFIYSLSSVLKKKWFEMRLPNQIFSNVFYNTGINVLGFDSLFKIFLCF